VRSTSARRGKSGEADKAGPGRAVLREADTSAERGKGTVNQILAHKGRALAREESYALRREMIRRLQGSTSGLPRGERSRRLRAFAEGWQELAWRGGLGSLADLLDQEGSVAAPGIPAILLSLATRSEAEPGSRCVAGDDRMREADARTLSSRHIGRPETSRSELPSWWDHGRQGDLFPAGLMVQPL